MLLRFKEFDEFGIQLAKMKINIRNNQDGYLIIEALIAVVIFVLVGISLFSSISMFQIRSLKSKYDNEAALLVQEATEIAHTILQSDWGGYVDGEYYPVYDADNSDWILVPGEEENIQTRYKRNITLIEVCRNTVGGEQLTDFEETGNCSGEIDNNSRYVVTSVSWKEGELDKSISARLLVFRVPE